ncbi:33373_t:CDS:2, partial [Gigaspora margarita]
DHTNNSKKETSYTNLINYLDTKHENFISIYQQYLGNTISSIISFNYDTSVHNIFDWLDTLTVNKYLNSLANMYEKELKMLYLKRLELCLIGG